MMKRTASILMVAMLTVTSVARSIETPDGLKARALLGPSAAARLDGLAAKAGPVVKVSFAKTGRGVEVLVTGPTRSAVAEAMAELAREARSAGIDFAPRPDERTELRGVSPRPITLDRREAPAAFEAVADPDRPACPDPSGIARPENEIPPPASARPDPCQQRGPPRA